MIFCLLPFRLPPKRALSLPSQFSLRDSRPPTRLPHQRERQPPRTGSLIRGNGSLLARAPSSEGAAHPPTRLPLQRELSAKPTEGAARRPLPAGGVPPMLGDASRPGRQPIPKPPLCKGRWLAFRRDGRIVPSLSAQATHSFFSQYRCEEQGGAPRPTPRFLF